MTHLTSQNDFEIRNLDGANALIKTIVIIDDRILVAECFARCLQTLRPECRILYFSNALDWLASEDPDEGDCLVLFTISGRLAEDDSVKNTIESIHEICPSAPIILMSDNEDAVQILEALDHGARGYIPTSVTLNIALEAMTLVGVGGTYIPASSLLSSRKSILGGSSRPAFETCGTFTARQAAVIQALRQGKANKIIAYELNMRESTVKVHVRNIMKKLRAKNRTEVAYLTNSQIFPAGAGE